jgi:pimeloyl-ACP methyl ester carboxylesterase
MPLLETPNATLYYDIFEPDFTVLPDPPHIHTVLLLHGFAGTPENDFAGQLPHLRSRYRVLAPHLHGYGRSSQRTTYRLSFYRDDVEDMITLLDALHLQQVLVLSFSDGGTSGLLLAALHPQRVQALAVLGAQPSINAQNVAAIRHWLLEKPLSEEWQEQLAELHGELYWRTLPGMYVAGQEALVASGGTIISDEELASIRCPALIMHGVRDRVVPADYARIIAERMPGSRLLLFDAGHAAHLRCEEEYKAAVMDFFMEHTSGK